MKKLDALATLVKPPAKDEKFGSGTLLGSAVAASRVTTSVVMNDRFIINVFGKTTTATRRQLSLAMYEGGNLFIFGSFPCAQD